ncbi:MAG: ATP-binding protein [Chloroflexi bacterium]|nr:ATP-binding protein [Chloroflexota bacterium]
MTTGRNGYRRRTFPFTAIVGQEKMKKALLLNAINPSIGGVLLTGERGTAKSTAVRALADLLPDIDVVEGCPFSCDPRNPEELCDVCQERAKNGPLPALRRPMPIVNLPLSATEDRVIGTLDLAKALREGVKALEPGLLAAANRGILYVDEINLLDDHLVDVLLDSAASGVNIVEREGIALSHPARFILIGSMNPKEGELRPQIIDRIGLQVEIKAIGDPDRRTRILEREDTFLRSPQTLIDEFAPQQESLRAAICVAQSLFPKVEFPRPLLRGIALLCRSQSVEGHRADITALQCATTLAAYHGRTSVKRDDVFEAVELALPHRMALDGSVSDGVLRAIHDELEKILDEETIVIGVDGDASEEPSEENGEQFEGNNSEPGLVAIDPQQVLQSKKKD